VLDGEKVLSAVTCEEIERLVQCRVVSGGMVLKLEAAKRAIEGGVREVRIVGGTSTDALLLASHAAEMSDAGVASVPGTRVLREPLSAAHAALSAA
jgi:acetylglutamate kinase